MVNNPLTFEEKAEIVSAVFKEWKEASPIIADFFRQRDRESATKPMIVQSEKFLQTLFLVNCKQIDENLTNWKAQISAFEHLPVNAVERLFFIFEQPDHYQSYIQLSELFSEWEKKSVILMRRKT
ncbi:YpoC family protein [Bacillus sp. NEB1478]|uniref:YpoC family protein n=1 Tax=Bacillus sp. NEB1478 TaxID=3073816 RepID=UPI0028737822|nr:hypothetical protein [Bacillus sp. NEB1478]WNB93762.1 hypothetical protein RGB74_08870 [Bacillus sp. NEB1478]